MSDDKLRDEFFVGYFKNVFEVKIWSCQKNLQAAIVHFCPITILSKCNSFRMGCKTLWKAIPNVKANSTSQRICTNRTWLAGLISKAEIMTRFTLKTSNVIIVRSKQVKYVYDISITQSFYENI